LLFIHIKNYTKKRGAKAPLNFQLIG